MSIAEKLATIAETELKVYEAGVQAELARFWDAYQEGGERTNYNYLFSYSGWTDENFKPQYPITCKGGSTNATAVFNYCTKITEIPVPIIVEGIPATQLFYRATQLVKVKKLVLNGVTSFTNAFTACSKLVTLPIEGSIDVNFNISPAPDLDADTRASIVAALKDLTGQTMQTLTVHATVGANLTDEQKATITAKNWELVY